MGEKTNWAELIKIAGMIVGAIAFYFLSIQGLESRIVRLETQQELLISYIKEIRQDVKDIVHDQGQHAK